MKPTATKKVTKAPARPASSGRKAKHTAQTPASILSTVVGLLEQAATLAASSYRMPRHPDMVELSTLSSILHFVLIMRREALASGQDLAFAGDPTQRKGRGILLTMLPKQKQPLHHEARDRIDALAYHTRVSLDLARDPDERDALHLYASVLEEVVTMIDTKPAGHLLTRTAYRASDGTRRLTLAHVDPDADPCPVEPKPAPEQPTARVLPFRRKGAPKAAADDTGPATLRSP